LRKQSDDKAAAIVRAANQRADSMVATARAQAAKLGSKPWRHECVVSAPTTWPTRD